MRGLGTAINVATVLVGTGVGLALGHRLPERVRGTMLSGVGLVTIVLGVSQGLETRNLLFPLVSVVLGALIGELGSLEERLEGLGERIRRRVERETARESRFVEGFVAASLVFCVGPLTILGSIQDGLAGDFELLAVKAALDGLVAIVFASTLGIGVGFSALTVLLYQGALTGGAFVLDEALTERMIAEATATGGVMVIGIGIRLLELRAIRVAAMLPGLLIAPIAVALFAT
jgi:uncharacterized membrane protein YqgA involved in biofilm formation